MFNKNNTETENFRQTLVAVRETKPGTEVTVISGDVMGAFLYLGEDDSWVYVIGIDKQKGIPTALPKSSTIIYFTELRTIMPDKYKNRGRTLGGNA